MKHLQLRRLCLATSESELRKWEWLDQRLTSQ